MATVNWVILKHHKKNDATYNPKIRIIHNRTTSYIPTGIFTQFVRFKKGSSSGIITDGDVEDALNDQVKMIRKIINTHQTVVGNCDTAKRLVEFIQNYLNRQNIEIDFIQYAWTLIDSIPKRGTRINYITSINALSHYLNEKNGNEKLRIQDFSSKFLKSFELWLRQDRIVTIKGKSRLLKAISDGGIRVYMNALQSIFNKAGEHYNDYELEDIVIKGNPFKAYKIPKIKNTRKRALTNEEIIKIYNYIPEKDGTCDALAKDMFILSFVMAGMNAADILSCEKYVKGRIEYNRQKTKDRKQNDQAFISIQVPDLIKPIFEKYRDPEGKKVFFLYKRFRTNNALNVILHRGLKIIGEKAGIENLQFYAARHSFATIARNECGISMDDIAFSLTHTSGYRITDIYIKPDYEKVDRVILKVINKVFNVD